MLKRLLPVLPGLLAMLIFYSGCVKEYSFEGGNTPVVIDTTNPPAPASWICPDCIGRDVFEESRWSFYNENSFLCGIIDTAIVNPERTAFTFFGPSSCSIDTGMIASVYLNGTVLNSNITNLSSQRGAFYYYDNVGQTTILISRQANPFTVTIDSYNHQTRMATGTFSGPVFTSNGGPTFIVSGKYKVKLM